MNTLSKYKTFIIDKYTVDLESFKVTFYFSFDNKIEFKEEIVFPKPKTITKEKRDFLKVILPYLQIILGISYFKSFNPKEIIIKENTLNKKQASFFSKLYTLGLGEFAFKNQIKVDVDFPYVDNNSIFRNNCKLEDKVLLPIGGGKDSIVSLEIIRKLNTEFLLFYVGDSFLIQNFVKKHNFPIVYVKRKICKNLMELNKKGALNGHIPITAINSFLSFITAYMLNIKNIYFSNEHSANIGNVKYNDVLVNHQYSKSFEFECDFREFLANLGFKNINYASILRPVSELLIFKNFSKLNNYFNDFSSCNTNFKIKDKKNTILWCGECPKCAFVYVMLASFLNRSKLNEIFKKDLFSNKDLVELFEELAGLRNFKPFECVGETDEVKISLKNLFDIDEYKNTPVVNYFFKKHFKEINNVTEKKYLKIYNEHNLDDSIINLLKNELL